MGRPKRKVLPEGIGKEPDHVVALREGCSREAIIYLRNANAIPPASEPWRSKWIAKRNDPK
jgi:hypothetical protein|tara:strand:- start:301 stop:483 length:183 start_codon:yes stop_codon:yes gene_type:complete